ncbi:hypothetical protein ACLKA7_005111 [Drosophila subpalustris]
MGDDLVKLMEAALLHQATMMEARFEKKVEKITKSFEEKLGTLQASTGKTYEKKRYDRGDNQEEDLEEQQDHEEHEEEHEEQDEQNEDEQEQQQDRKPLLNATTSPSTSKKRCIHISDTHIEFISADPEEDNITDITEAKNLEEHNTNTIQIQTSASQKEKKPELIKLFFLYCYCY